MIDDDLAVDVEGADLVPAKPLRRPRMEVAGILVPLLDGPELPPLLPVRRRTADRGGEVGTGVLPQSKLVT